MNIDYNEVGFSPIEMMLLYLDYFDIEHR